jgi:hypothetical protein
MDKTEVIAQLAGQMETSEQQAEIWLEAVLDVLHGTFTADASTGGAVESDEGLVKNETTSAGDVPVLRSVTPTARLSIGDEIVLDRFPFRVGREGRTHPTAGILSEAERRAPPQRTSNELYVKDFGKSVNVSREHFQIEAKSDGSYELVDRGSACGTIVGSHVIGGNFSGGRCPLQFGDAIVVGTRESAIVFEFSQAIA